MGVGGAGSLGAVNIFKFQSLENLKQQFLNLRKACCKGVVLCENTKSDINSFYILLIDRCMGIFHTLFISLNFACLAFIGFYGKQKA